MHLNPAPIAACALLVAVGCAEPKAVTQKPAPPQPAFDARLASRETSFFRQRVERDPNGAIGWAMLSSAYLEEARESDSDALAAKAEEAARRSLRLRRKRNGRAAMALAQALLEQHRFAAALDATDLAVSIEPGPGAARLRAEILLELGRYDLAEMAMRRAGDLRGDPTGRALAARWSELHGRTDAALGHWRSAIALVNGRAGSEAAWFHGRYADALARAGKSDDAKAEYERALQLNPRDHRALAGLARIAAAKEDWEACRRHAEASVRIAKLTDTMGILGDAYLALGDENAAKRIYREVDARNRESREGYEHERAHGHSHRHPHGHSSGDHTHDRLYAHFLADRGRDLPIALRAAEEDLELRKDVYAWDTLAWAAFRAGRMDRARKAAEVATSLGTRDPRICLHAGLIYAKAGSRPKAIHYLTTATRGVLTPRERRWAETALAKLRHR